MAEEEIVIIRQK